MRIRPRSLALCAAAVLIGSSASPVALAVQVIFTPEPFAWTIVYYPENALSGNYCPEARVLWLGTAIHEPGNFPLGEPEGYLPGYAAKGFLAPFVAGNDVHVQASDNSNATDTRIIIKADSCLTGGYLDLFDTIGHELFHGTQFTYTAGWNEKFEGLGDYVIEGHAKTMEGKIFQSIPSVEVIGASKPIFADTSAGTTKNARDYMTNLTSKSIWLEDYETALWWLFLSKEYGSDLAIPGVGIDFMRRFQENTAVLSGVNSGIKVLKTTLAQSGETTPLPEIFRRFATANEARNYSFAPGVAPVPGTSTYFYPQETLTGQALYGQVTFTNSVNLAPGVVNGSGTVAQYAARYYQADLSEADVTCQDGVVGFRAKSDSTDISSFTVMFVDQGNVIRHLLTSGTEGNLGDEYVATIAQSGGQLSKLIAVVTGVNSSEGLVPTITSDFDYTFACGPANIEITQPDLSSTPAFPAYAGRPGAPERILVRVRVTGPPALGSSSVLGLAKDQFTVWIGDEADPKIPANLAQVLSGHQSKGEYFLIVQPPVKPGAPLGSVHDLVVKLGGESATVNVTLDTEAQSVIYDLQQIDMQLVIDHSGSMSDSGKMDAAKSVAKAYVDWAQSDDRLGITKFETNASLVVPLDEMTSESKRGLFKAFIDLIVPAGGTSIGDGLTTAKNDLLASGRPPPAQPWMLLLSDGYENDAEWVADALPSVTSNGILVHTVALGSDTDQNLLQWIANQPEDREPKGRYEYIPDPEGAGAGAAASFAPASIGNSVARNLADAYRTMYEDSHRFERLWEAAGSGPLTHPLAIEEDTITKLVLSLYWEDPLSPMTLTLTDPNGMPVTAATAGARVVSDAQHAVVQLDTLPPGSWQIGIAGSGNYHAVMSGKVRTGVQVELLFGQFHGDPFAYSLQGLYLPGIPMPIVAMITDDLGPIAGAQVQAEILNPNGTEKSLTLFDDGAHYDGIAGDGVYASLYHLTATGGTTGYQLDPPLGNVGPGSYKVAVGASGTNNRAQAFERIKKGSFHLLDHPELDADQEPDGLPDRWEDRFDCVDSTVVDSTLDPDGDALITHEELYNGTDPCNPDTDFGGEPDGSEVSADRDPRAPSDDFIAPLIDLQVATHLFHTHDPTTWLAPNALTLRFGLDPTMQQIEIHRRVQGQVNFSLLSTIGAQATSGIHRDLGLTTGVTYEYYAVPIGLNSVRGVPSRVISGTARLDPYPPEGEIEIDEGRDSVPDTLHRLALTYSGDAVEMRLSQNSEFPFASWNPVAPTAVFSSTPDPQGVIDIYVQYRDAAGNVSHPSSDSTRLDPAGSYGDLGGSVLLVPPNTYGGLAGVAIFVAGDATAYSDSLGDFALHNLAAGSYDVYASRAGYQAVMPVPAIVPAGATATLGQIAMYAIDTDNDGLWDLDEFTLGTDPQLADTDGDGIQDGTEIGATTGVPDPDGAGPLLGTDAGSFVPDADPSTKTDPLDPDSDGDGYSDGQEDANQNGLVDPGESDPLDPFSFPAPPVPLLPFTLDHEVRVP